jgi:hypothetical protein
MIDLRRRELTRPRGHLLDRFLSHGNRFLLDLGGHSKLKVAPEFAYKSFGFVRVTLPVQARQKPDRANSPQSQAYTFCLARFSSPMKYSVASSFACFS